MSLSARLEAEQAFHDRQAAERAPRFAQLASLRFTDDSYLDHATWIRPAMTKLGDAAVEIEGAAKDLRAMVGRLQGPTGDFATTGLPQITSAVASLQQATENLDRVLSEVWKVDQAATLDSLLESLVIPTRA